MKLLKEVTLIQFKNYSNRKFHFDGNLIAVLGKNGTGKSNLLDAVYYLCFTKSYFHNKEIFNIQKGTNGFRLAGTFIDTDSQESEEVACVWKEGKKTIYSKSKIFDKLSDYIGQYCAVMIAPDDIRIINEGGEFRRKFFDGLISQLEPFYLDSLLQYQKILTQKNAHLKQNLPANRSKQLIEIYNQQLTESGEVISTKRKEITDKISDYVQEFYHELSGSTEQIRIRYTPNIDSGEWGQTLAYSIHRELEIGRVLSGAHLDDWEFELEGFQFKHQASQGQKKSLLIALKMAQVKVLTEVSKTPILLLDDIFEKLDRNRIETLFHILHRMQHGQIFLTHTYQKDVEDHIAPIISDIQYLDL